MSLTPQEKKELNYANLNDNLKRKLDCAFESRYFNTALTLAIQIDAFESEIQEKPFTIRGSVDNEGSRQEAEAVVKILKWLAEDATNDLEILQNKLTPEENRQILKKVTTASDLKKTAFGE